MLVCLYITPGCNNEPSGIFAPAPYQFIVFVVAEYNVGTLLKVDVNTDGGVETSVDIIVVVVPSVSVYCSPTIIL